MRGWPGASGRDQSDHPNDRSRHRPLSVYYAHVKSSDLVRELTKDGWFLSRTRGSHHVFKHTTRPGHVVVPHPKKDLGVGLVAAIRKQAGL